MLCPSAFSSNRSVAIVHLAGSFPHDFHDAFTIREENRVRRAASSDFENGGHTGIRVIEIDSMRK